jgi:hypothetical protein
MNYRFGKASLNNDIAWGLCLIASRKSEHDEADDISKVREPADRQTGQPLVALTGLQYDVLPIMRADL